MDGRVEREIEQMLLELDRKYEQQKLDAFDELIATSDDYELQWFDIIWIQQEGRN